MFHLMLTFWLAKFPKEFTFRFHSISRLIHFRLYEANQFFDLIFQECQSFWKGRFHLRLHTLSLNFQADQVVFLYWACIEWAYEYSFYHFLCVLEDFLLYSLMLKDLDGFFLFQVSICSLDFHFPRAGPIEFHFLFTLFSNDLFTNCVFLSLKLLLFYEIFFVCGELPVTSIFDFKIQFHFSWVPLVHHLFLL